MSDAGQPSDADVETVTGRPPDAGTGEIHRPPAEAYSRTWELELIISGAVLYALIQLPGAIDRWYYGVDPHLTGAMHGMARMIYYYSKLACYTLGAAFIIHLAARAYWVGLLGLDTAFPHGVRWERLGQSPIIQEVYQERQPPLETLIGRVDRFCSIIFSFAFIVVFIFVYSVLAFAALGLVALPISLLLFDGEGMGGITRVLVMVLFAPIVILSLVDRFAGRGLDSSRGVGRLIHRYAPPAVVRMVDRALGRKLDSSRGLGRVIRGATGAFYTVTGGITYIPVFNVLQTNVRKVAFHGTFAAVFAGVLGLFLVKDALLPAGRISVSGYEYLPERGAPGTIDPLHYEDERVEEGRLGEHPVIQSQAIRDPFVRLFVPYLPRRHGEVMEEVCPGVRVLGGSGPRLLARSPPVPEPAAARAVLACLATLQPVRLNGQPIDPEYRFYTEPHTERRGIVAYIAVDGLPAGENRLVVAALPTEDHETPPPYEIPFWVDRSGGDDAAGP